MKTTSLDEKWRVVGEELTIPATTQRILDETMTKLEAYHLPTAEHCKRVGILAVHIGQYVGLPLRPLFYGASLHDRGKLNVTRQLLDKTGEWTEEDALALREHPTDGYDVTIGEGMVVTAGLIIRHHTFQPNNYPEVVPDAPPYMAGNFANCARTIALADFYDAAHRRNSEALDSEEQIRAKVLSHAADLGQLAEELYDKGIF